MTDIREIVGCVKCEQRSKEERQALNRCEQEQVKANKINQRMAIAIAVLSTLIGKEALDRLTQVTDVVDKLQTVDLDEGKIDLTYPRYADRSVKIPDGNTSALLANIPGSILPPHKPEIDLSLMNFGFTTDSTETVVPFAGPMLLFALAMVRTRSRDP